MQITLSALWASSSNRQIVRFAALKVGAEV